MEEGRNVLESEVLLLFMHRELLKSLEDDVDSIADFRVAFGLLASFP